MTDPRARLLEDFGLAGYAARAYLAVLDLGPATARFVAERAAIPQGRVYDVLDKLAAQGLVTALPEVPKRYQASPFAHFLDRQVAQHHARAEALERDRAALEETMRPPQAPPPAEAPGGFVVVRGRRNLVEHVGVLLGGTSAEVLAVGPEPGIDWARRHAGPLASAVARGVRLRALLPPGPGALEAAAAAVKRGVEVRHGPDVGELNLVAFDDTKALVYAAPGDAPGEAGSGADATADAGVLVRDPAVVRGLRALAEAMWTRGDPMGPPGTPAAAAGRRERGAGPAPQARPPAPGPAAVPAPAPVLPPAQDPGGR